MKGAGPAFASFRKQPGKERGRLQGTMARHLEEQKDQLVLIADSETSLGHDRLGFELKRTITELELFAGLAESGKWKEQKEEPSEPNRKPIPKPGMQTANVPIGPVLVIGACNFPLPFQSSERTRLPHWQSDVQSWSKHTLIMPAPANPWLIWSKNP